MEQRRIDYTGFVARFFLSAFVVFAVYNPGQYSWWHWVTSGDGRGWHLKILAGLALAISLFIMARATYQSIGGLGIAAVLVLNSLLAWTLASFGVFDMRDLNTWITAAMLSLVILFTVGLCYGLVYHRLTGIVHTEPTH